MCDGLPVCVATDKLRPCTAAELLARQYKQDQKTVHVDSPEQQSFIDDREFAGKKGKHKLGLRAKNVVRTIVKDKVQPRKKKTKEFDPDPPPDLIGED